MGKTSGVGTRTLKSNLMSNCRFFGIAAPVALAIFAVAVYSQVPAEPSAYTVTVQYHVTGTAVRTTYRLGSKVLVDEVPSPGSPPSAVPAAPTRTLYLLDTGQSLSWEPARVAAACSRSSFHGDAWLNPFSGLADLVAPGVTQVGSEVVLGIATKILVSKAKPGIRLWVDPKTGLMLKADFTEPSSDKTIPNFEVTEVHLEPPPIRLFEIPAQCTAEPQR